MGMCHLGFPPPSLGSQFMTDHVMSMLHTRHEVSGWPNKRACEQILDIWLTLLEFGLINDRYCSLTVAGDAAIKDPFSLTVMLCALFVVKRGHWPEQPLLGQFMASDLGEEMDTETEISGDIRNLLPREGSLNAYGFHLGEMKANRTKMMARHVVKLREIQVVCVLRIFFKLSSKMLFVLCNSTRFPYNPIHLLCIQFFV